MYGINYLSNSPAVLLFNTKPANPQFTHRSAVFDPLFLTRKIPIEKTR